MVFNKKGAWNIEVIGQIALWAAGALLVIGGIVLFTTRGTEITEFIKNLLSFR
ncbi:MAG: hypothetical protein AABX17_02130 [Nanoarchaeota archaeon]